MENLKFYVLLSTVDKPQEIPLASDTEAGEPINSRGQQDFEGILPLPLPNFLMIFALGEWPDDRFQQMSAEVHLGKDLDPFQIGTLSKDNRSVCWQGTWRDDLYVRGTLMSDEGQPGLLVITPSSSDQNAAAQSHSKNNSQELKTSPIKSTAMRTGDSSNDMEILESSQTESQLANSVMEPGFDQENVAPEDENTRPSGYGAVTNKETPSKIAAVRLKTEVALERSEPPSLTTSSRKRRKSAAEESSTPGRQIRVKRLQMQQNSRSVGKGSTAGRGTNSTADGAEPSARWGHTMCAISKKQAVLIGGQGEHQHLSKDSVWLLDIDTKSWCVPGISHAESTKPQYRMGHTAVYDPNVKCVYVYGGSKNIRWYNDVHVLDIESWRWSLVKANGRAPTRAYHTSTLFNKEMYVFGGVYPNPDPEPDGCSAQLHVFTPETESWYEPLVMGTKPQARSGHSATLLENKLIIFGGWDAPKCFNDVYCLDLGGLMEYTSIDVRGTPPSPRSWHASAALPGNRILIQGGFDGENAMTDAFVFRLDSECWTQLVWPIPTTPTAGHTILTINPRHSLFGDDNEDKENDDANGQQKLFIFGGGNNEGAFSSKLIDMKLQMPSDS
ncbi:rab9 effector protein with kelch motifs-like isoform X1 [Patiria miniata]|uniref:Uncharacterized protein n=1 Tax=Patiria miniata TaxID=46514 RepID=A0A914BTY1_PATMI|nr:rab9 effector protein with kelch motifs-like isoform X1 [Patiria miniata]